MNEPNITEEQLKYIKLLIYKEIKSEKNESVQRAIFYELSWIFKNIEKKLGYDNKTSTTESDKGY